MYPSNYFFVSVPKKQISRLIFLNQFRNSVWYICFENNKKIVLHYIRRVVLVPLSKKIYQPPPLPNNLPPLLNFHTKIGSAQQPRCSGGGGGAAAAPAGGGGSGVALLGLRRGGAADRLATADDDDRCALAGSRRDQAGAAARGRSADASARGGSGVALLGSCLGRAADVSACAERSLAVAPAGGGSGAGSGR
jgi:hypothetical protein